MFPLPVSALAGFAALAVAAVAVGLLLLDLDEILDVHEDGLLLEGLAGQVVHVLTAGLEAEVEALDVGAHVEVILLGHALALDGQVERAQVSELHLLALEELLQQTVLQFDGHAAADVLAVDGVVLRHVLDEFTIGHGLGGDHFAVVLAIGGRLGVVVAVDLD